MNPSLHHKDRAIIAQFPCLSDNYGWLVHDISTGKTASIDTPDADAINQVLKEQGWSLDMILNTHWHLDHTGGNEALRKKWGCQITGPALEAAHIPTLDHPISEGAAVTVGSLKAEVLETPGHTAGHCIYYFPELETAFVGDTIFSLGCGRLFEGTPAQMWASLKKIRQLPATTELCCAHEYTAANARFALTVEPDNQALLERSEQVEALRRQNLPTVPTPLSLEMATNPFLRADLAETKKALNMSAAPAEDVFAKIRLDKDNF